MNGSGFSIKKIGQAALDEERGEVEAVVATLGTVDKDGDVFLASAFPERSRVWISGFGHDVTRQGLPPAGRGHIEPDGDRATLRGRFFLDTDRGRESFRVVKNLGADGEWSIGFPERSVRTARLTDAWRKRGARRLIESFEPVEASPVFMAAGFGTHTIAAKERRDERSTDDELSREVEATLARAGTPVGLPLPDRFKSFVRWAGARFAMSPSQIPPVVVVSGSSLDRRSPGAMGLHHDPSGTVCVRAGLDDEDVRRVVLHEFSHAYESRQGWLHSERFAYGQEDPLLERWRRESA